MSSKDKILSLYTHIISRIETTDILVSYVPRSCREDWRKNDDKVNGKGTR